MGTFLRHNVCTVMQFLSFTFYSKVREVRTLQILLYEHLDIIAYVCIIIVIILRNMQIYFLLNTLVSWSKHDR